MAATKKSTSPRRNRKRSPVSDQELARKAANALAEFRADGRPVKLTLNGKLTILVPESTLKAMSKACTTDANEEMTTQEAADYLNVSRPYLIQLINDGKLPFRRVGTHRRLRKADVVHYDKQVSDARSKGLDELAAEGQRLGLWI